MPLPKYSLLYLNWTTKITYFRIYLKFLLGNSIVVSMGPQYVWQKNGKRHSEDSVSQSEKCMETNKAIFQSKK